MNNTNYKKKILFITSLYSGIKDSVIQRRWNPKGMPAIVKLLEYLNTYDINFDYVFLSNNKDNIFKIDFFNDSIFFFIQRFKFKIKFKIISDIINSFVNVYRINKKIDINSYDIIYLDRANVDLIPFLKYFYKGKIFLRLHGIHTLYQNFSNSGFYRFQNYFKRLSFKQKIDYVIASKDGTPVEIFLQKFLHKDTPRKVLLNGVEIVDDVKFNFDRKRLIFLVLGRLEVDKGIFEIIESFSSLNKKFQKNWELWIIGDGSLKSFVQKSEINNSSIKYLGKMTFFEVSLKFKEVDVVISLNQLGNLSNVVLESINNEKMIITLKKDLENDFDIESNSFLTDNVKYVSRYQMKNNLISLLEEIFQNKNIVSEFSSKTKNNLKPKLIGWKDRINAEVTVLNNL